MSRSVKDPQLRAVASRFLRARPMIATPASCVAMIAIYAAGVRGVQLALLLLTAIALNALFIFEHRRYRRIDVTRVGFFWSLLVTVVGLTTLCVLTGGIQSPLLPIWFAPTGIMIAAFGGDRLFRHAMTASLATLVALIVTSALTLPLTPIPRPFSLVMLAGTVAVSMALLSVGVGGLTAGYAELAETLDTLRRQAVEDADERSRTLDSVGARVAHEIRNPMTAIKGLVQLEQRSVSSDKSGERLAVVASEIARMEGIVEDYLRFARPLADLRLGEVDLRVLVDDVGSLVEGTAESAGIVVATRGETLRVTADPNLLKQAVLNLTKNAIEATPAGGTITLSVGLADAHPFIEVRDTGRGMDQAVVARVAEAFFSGRAGGTGLGVTLAKTIASQHEGDLAYSSTVGEGTAARLILGRPRAT